MILLVNPLTGKQCPAKTKMTCQNTLECWCVRSMVKVFEPLKLCVYHLMDINRQNILFILWGRNIVKDTLSFSNISKLLYLLDKVVVDRGSQNTPYTFPIA